MNLFIYFAVEMYDLNIFFEEINEIIQINRKLKIIVNNKNEIKYI